MENEWASEQNPNRYFRFYQKHSDTIEGFSVVTGKRVNLIDDKISKTNVIGHEPTVTELFRWLIENDSKYAAPGIWEDCIIFYGPEEKNARIKIPFDLSKSLLSQSEETKKAIIELITLYS